MIFLARRRHTEGWKGGREVEEAARRFAEAPIPSLQTAKIQAAPNVTCGQRTGYRFWPCFINPLSLFLLIAILLAYHLHTTSSTYTALSHKEFLHSHTPFATRRSHQQGNNKFNQSKNTDPDIEDVVCYPEPRSTFRPVKILIHDYSVVGLDFGTQNAVIVSQPRHAPPFTAT